MAGLVATLITDKRIAAPPRIRRTSDGLEAECSYFINTRNQDEAFFVGPAYSDAWSAKFPTLKVYDLEVQQYAGQDRSGTPPTGGLCIKRCLFRTPSGGKLAPPGVQGLSYTELDCGTETLTVMYDVNPAFTAPLSNGEGAPKLTGVVRAMVTVYVALNQAPDYGRLIGLTRRKPLNDDVLTLPKLVGTNVELQQAPGTVRYEGFRSSVENDLLKVTHELTLADDFDFIWIREDQKGNAIQSVVSTIYGSEDLNNLW